MFLQVAAKIFAAIKAAYALEEFSGQDQLSWSDVWAWTCANIEEAKALVQLKEDATRVVNGLIKEVVESHYGINRRAVSVLDMVDSSQMLVSKEDGVNIVTPLREMRKLVDFMNDFIAQFSIGEVIVMDGQRYIVGTKDDVRYEGSYNKILCPV